MRKLNMDELERMSCSEFRKSNKLPVIVVLDNVRSLYNIGSVFRTSDAFRIERIILCGITATPENSLTEIHKTALGAEDTVDWIYYQNTEDALNSVKEEGYIPVAIEQVCDSVKLGALEITKGKYALFFGNEVKGVSQSVVDKCDFAIEIPQYGTKHSLNVSVSAGIVLWEFVRQLRELLES